MPAAKGNKYAAKPETKSSPMTIRLTPKAYQQAKELATKKSLTVRQVVQSLANAELENWKDDPIIL